MSKVKGHSNAMVDQITTISTTQAMIPIHGGATVTTYRELPSLILTEKEWRMIGEQMGWSTDADSERSHESLCPQRVGGECECGAFEHNEQVRSRAATTTTSK